MATHKIIVLGALLVTFCRGDFAQAQLVVHEWGTMTTVHAPNGRAQERVNLIDHADVLPNFVHHFEPKQSGNAVFAPFAKDTRTLGRPDVTMRLETPVIYFYDRGNSLGGQPFDVRVHMRGGILNDFYPQAVPTLSRHGSANLKVTDAITLDRTWGSTLEWHGIRLDDAARIPQTNATVWLAPRQVKAAKITVANEGEHYLFYRGLANVPALLTTQHSATSVRLGAPRDRSWIGNDGTTIARVWLVDVRANGTLAFTTHDQLMLDKNVAADSLTTLPRFKKTDFSDARGAALRASMQATLVNAGLFADEAAAMLNAWHASYFRKPGLRVFYMVPRAWTDYFLPLELSVPHEATRVLIGRIDLQTADETT